MRRPLNRQVVGLWDDHARIRAPRPQELRELVETLAPSAWPRHRIKEGSKGPIIADFAFLHLTTMREDLPGPRVWVIFRRQVCPAPDLKFYLSNAPSSCSHAELIRVCGLRWPVETALEEGKDELGMDRYETCGWVSWHHHIGQTFMRHLFLMHLRLVFKKSPALTLAQARQLIARALADEQEERPDVLPVIAYRQQRNYAAYCSHRRRTLKRNR